MADADHPTNVSARYHKPNRTSQACTTCRARKTRCDGRRPKCIACERRGVATDCSYDSDPGSSRADGTTASSQIPPGEGPSSERSSKRSRTVAYYPADSGSSTSSHTLYNASSRSAFAQRVLPRPSLRQKTHRPSNALLIPRPQADAYVKSYFTFSWPLFPVLDQDDFMASYHSLWSGDPDPSFDIIAHAVFAIGCRGAEPLPDSDTHGASEGFFQAAKDQLNLFDVVEGPTLEDVQALLLMVIHLHASGNALRCWTLHGMTMRFAHAIGLDFEPPGLSNDRIVNLRRCVWHCCVNLDRLNSMSFGQPMLSHNTTSNTPLPSLGPEVEGEYSPLSLFVSSALLYDILEDLLIVLQDIDLTRIPEDVGRWKGSITEILKVCWRLDHFYTNVPTALRDWDAPSGTDGGLQVQQRVLRCRYLLTRVLAHQPMLMISIQDRASSQHSSLSLIKHGCKECLEAAHEIADRLWMTLFTPWRSAPWHATYYVFTAASILLASSRSPVMDVHPGDARFDLTWERCLAILAHHGQNVPVAAKAAAVLRSMREEMLGPEREVVHADGGAQGSAIDAGAGVYPSWLFGTWFNNTGDLQDEIGLGVMQDWFGPGV